MRVGNPQVQGLGEGGVSAHLVIRTLLRAGSLRRPSLPPEGAGRGPGPRKGGDWMVRRSTAHALGPLSLGSRNQRPDPARSTSWTSERSISGCMASHCTTISRYGPLGAVWAVSLAAPSSPLLLLLRAPWAWPQPSMGISSVVLCSPSSVFTCSSKCTAAACQLLTAGRVLTLLSPHPLSQHPAQLLLSRWLAEEGPQSA